MRLSLKIISYAALVATILPSILFLADRITLDHAKWTMLAATALWFAVAPCWIGRPRIEDDELVI
jgi:hypothetical protein